MAHKERSASAALWCIGNQQRVEFHFQIIRISLEQARRKQTLNNSLAKSFWYIVEYIIYSYILCI